MVELTGETLTIEQLVAVARDGERVAPLTPEVQARMQRSHQWVVDAIADAGKIIYGVNTGFGALANRRVSAAEAQRLSRNVIAACAPAWAIRCPRMWCAA